jgi:hypothetical protein
MCPRQKPIKKIIVACPIDKGDAGRLTLVTNTCSIVRNAPGRMNMHSPGNASRLTLVANKCSIV